MGIIFGFGGGFVNSLAIFVHELFLFGGGFSGDFRMHHCPGVFPFCDGASSSNVALRSPQTVRTVKDG